MMSLLGGQNSPVFTSAAPFGYAITAASFGAGVPALIVCLVTLVGTAIKFGGSGLLFYILTPVSYTHLDPDEVAKYEEREWSIMRYDVEMRTNRELGEKEGEARGLKIGEKRGLKIGKEQGRKEEKTKIIKKLYSLNTPIEKIAEITEMCIEDVKKIVK